MRMRPFGDLLPLPEAQRRVWDEIRPVLGAEEVPLGEGLGRIAAATVRSPRNVPEFSRATWDGYALRSRDSAAASPEHPVALRVAGEVFAEGRFARRLRPGEAVAIATGGALPPGTDTVAIFEESRFDGGAIHLDRPRTPGERVAAPGDDFPRGRTLLEAGAVLDAAALGALGAIGRRTVRVRRRPVVALLPNGNELLALGAPRRRGSIYEINNLTLGAVVRASGGVPVSLPPVHDDEAAITRAIRRVLPRCDLLVVTGGSSVGERDFLPAIFPRVGRLLFHGVAVRPGKPTLAAVAGRRVLLGMPGHPTSCLANAFWLMLPALRRLAGLPGPGWTEGTVVAGPGWPAPHPSMSVVVPLHEEDGTGRPTFRDSSAITSLAGANAFAILPPGTAPVPAGATHGVYRLPATLAG